MPHESHHLLGLKVRAAVPRYAEVVPVRRNAQLNNGLQRLVQGAAVPDSQRRGSTAVGRVWHELQHVARLQTTNAQLTTDAAAAVCTVRAEVAERVWACAFKIGKGGGTHHGRSKLPSSQQAGNAP